TAHDVLLELRWIAEGNSQPGHPVPLSRARKTRENLAWAFAVISAVTSILLAILHFTRQGLESPTITFSVFPQEGASFGQATAISPDGTRLALIVAAPGNG